jgi:hypothetical protein
MAIVRPRAPRHILYIGPALLALGLTILALTGCTETEEPDRARSAAKPDKSAPGTAPTLQPDTRAVEPPRAPQTASSAPASPPSSPSPSPPGTEPSFHLDDSEVEYEIPRRTTRPRKGRTVQLVLRSSPPGAVAAVDGVALGPTPALWEGVVDSTPRDFTFVLPGYAIARYRFVPMRSGIVHGTLEPIEKEAEDGARAERKRGRPQRPAPQH